MSLRTGGCCGNGICQMRQSKFWVTLKYDHASYFRSLTLSLWSVVLINVSLLTIYANDDLTS